MLLAIGRFSEDAIGTHRLPNNKFINNTRLAFACSVRGTTTCSAVLLAADDSHLGARVRSALYCVTRGNSPCCGFLMSTQARVHVYVVDHPYMQGAVEPIFYILEMPSLHWSP